MSIPGQTFSSNIQEQLTNKVFLSSALPYFSITRLFCIVEENKLFYEMVKQTLKSLKLRVTTIIMRDFNANVRKGRCYKYVGEYGLGTKTKEKID